MERLLYWNPKIPKNISELVQANIVQYELCTISS